MNDATQNNENVAPGATNGLFKTAQDIERKVFSSERLQQANDYVAEAVETCKAENLPVVFNFNTDEPLPSGYSLATIPMTETVANKGRVTVGLAVAAIPDVQLILQDAGGAAWAVKRLTDSMLQTVKLAAQKDEGELSNLPFSIADFTSTGRVSAFTGFNAVAGEYVKALKKKSKSLAFISKILLRQILASSQFAEQQFPRIGQQNWEFIINAMIKSCGAIGVDAGILNHWLQTRNETTVSTADVDLSDLEQLIEKEHEKEEAKQHAKEAS